jgi:hypothetical protein
MQPYGKPTPKLIALSDNSFGGLPNFLSTNNPELKIVVGDYLAMENWEKSKCHKKVN